MVQVHHGRWFGTLFLFIGGRKPTYIGFLFIGGRKPTYVGFLLESIGKGHLIPGAVVFSISSFFHFGKLLSLGQSKRRLYNEYEQALLKQPK